MSFVDFESKREIFRRAAAKSMETGGPQGRIALHILSEKRHEEALESPDKVLERLSREVSENRNVICSQAYLQATLNMFEPKTPERCYALEQMLKTGSPSPHLSLFGNWDPS